MTISLTSWTVDHASDEILSIEEYETVRETNPSEVPTFESATGKLHALVVYFPKF